MIFCLLNFDALATMTKTRTPSTAFWEGTPLATPIIARGIMLVDIFEIGGA